MHNYVSAVCPCRRSVDLSRQWIAENTPFISECKHRKHSWEVEKYSTLKYYARYVDVSFSSAALSPHKYILCPSSASLSSLKSDFHFVLLSSHSFSFFAAPFTSIFLLLIFLMPLVFHFWCVSVLGRFSACKYYNIHSSENAMAPAFV